MEWADFNLESVNLYNKKSLFWAAFQKTIIAIEKGINNDLQLAKYVVSLKFQWLCLNPIRMLEPNFRKFANNYIFYDCFKRVLDVLEMVFWRLALQDVK